eukprot:TRINITY_DN4807_c0_g1_i1.p1 TRINITY_DN4807_c0_g1~~TRINITY_DN4807_c0_g1_i1.p1  ORF type:complete len:204 (+),score=35.06 TRINITY_DN4807_c0_g1_i1:35-646(+)
MFRPRISPSLSLLTSAINRRWTSSQTIFKRDFPFDIKFGVPPIHSPEALQVHFRLFYGDYYKKAKTFIDVYENNHLSIEDVIRRTALEKENQAGHLALSEVWNHNFFWNSISPNRTPPSDDLATSIRHTFGSFKRFSYLLKSHCLGLFGGGWVWLMYKDGEIYISHTSHTSTPLLKEGKPILALDVYEHAYLHDFAEDREVMN